MCVFLVTIVDYSLLHDGKTNEFIEFVPISIIDCLETCEHV